MNILDNVVVVVFIHFVFINLVASFFLSHRFFNMADVAINFSVLCSFRFY